MLADDLAAWLLEQLAEDQSEARDALERTTTSRRMIRGRMVEVKMEPPRWRSTAWPPSRVLAECDAKRKIVEHAQTIAAEVREDGSNVLLYGQHLALQTVLKQLALPYADRPGYRQEWQQP